MRKLPIVLALLFVMVASLHAQNAPKSNDDKKAALQVFEQKLKQASANAQILDARSEEEYKQNHLKGAVSVNVDNPEALQKVIDKLDKKKPVFVYSIGNGRSGKLAKQLKEQGFSDVSELPGGISNWIASGKPVESTVGAGLTLEEYKKLIQSDKLVLVDIGSKHCPGCKRMVPVVDSVARENAGAVKLVKIEFFENKQLAQDLGIQSIPAFLLYDGQRIVWQKSGIIPKAEIAGVVREKVEVALKKK